LTISSYSCKIAAPEEEKRKNATEQEKKKNTRSKKCRTYFYKAVSKTPFMYKYSVSLTMITLDSNTSFCY